LWHPLPAPRKAQESWFESALRIATAAWYLIIYGAVIVGLAQLRGKLLAVPWWWAFSLLLAFTLVHTFYWTDIRMRAPLMPVLALIAAFGIASLRPFTSFTPTRSFPDPNKSI
jgi:cytochrome bd-type quinol oxidase subunit 2